MRDEMRPAVLNLTMAACAALIGAFAPAAAEAADPCPNAAYRQGAGANLPDCRAWEQATPVDKGGAQPTVSIGAFLSLDGNRVLYGSPGNVGGASGVAYNGSYASTRGSAWSTVGLDGPLDSSERPFYDVISQATMGYSRDGSKALVISPRKLTPQAVEGASNLYVRDTADGSYIFAATAPGEALYDEITGILSVDGQTFVGASDDFTRIVFAAATGLTPNAPTSGLGLYEIRGGRISLVGLDPQGNPVGVGAPIHPDSPAPSVSADGRRVTFAAATSPGGDPSVYQRVDGASTVLISRSDSSQSDPDVPVRSSDGLPSADGTEVIFGFPDGGLPNVQKLTDDDAPSPFFRWTANSGRGTLTSLLRGVPRPWSAGAYAFSLLGVSPDRRYVWFSYRDFTDVDDQGTYFTTISVLDRTAGRISNKTTSFDANQPALFDLPTEAIRFSPDGTKLVFLSQRRLTGYDNFRPEAFCDAELARVDQSFHTCREAFTVDAKSTDTSPTCISCGPAGTHSAGDAGIANFTRKGRPLSTVITNDGTVFFDSPQPLVVGDANSSSDVYKYTPRAPLALLSSGTGSSAAKVAGATASGSDVFFFTGDPLVPQDTDDAIDIYDARANGGLASQQIVPSRGSSCPTGRCPAAPVPHPSAIAPGTLSARGSASRVAFDVARVTAAARRTAASTGRLRVRVRVGASGKISARATGRLRGRFSTLGASAAAVRKASRMTLTMKLSRAARHELARSRRLSIKLLVSYSRATRAKSQSFALSAPRPRSSSRGGSR